MDVTDHLFRHESGRLVAALTRVFGIHNLSLVEDVVQDAFCRALQVWRFRGIPENPSAWLMTTAKNRAVDVLRRERRTRQFSADMEEWLFSEWTLAPFVANALEEHSIRDDELRMMFSCCPPSLPEQAQVALILNVCCGFSANEIAAAFLVSSASMEKRIGRAKKALIESEKLFELESTADFRNRLTAVHRAIYLLFNEGFHGASCRQCVKSELCEEAMRLGELLARHPLASSPATKALCSLMALHAARIPARIDTAGRLTALFSQDRSQWNRRLIALGQKYLEASATGSEVSEFHIEAAIAWEHSRAESLAATDWTSIVTLYDVLLTFRHSPVIALNRAIAVGQSEGPRRGLEEIARIDGSDRLQEYPFYFAALGELESEIGNYEIAAGYYRRALLVARSPSEKEFLGDRADQCSAGIRRADVLRD